jgi:hypothetical protein
MGVYTDAHGLTGAHPEAIYSKGSSRQCTRHLIALPVEDEFMRRFRYVALIGVSVLAALVNILPAHAAVNHNETFLKD